MKKIYKNIAILVWLLSTQISNLPAAVAINSSFIGWMPTIQIKLPSSIYLNNYTGLPILVRYILPLILLGIIIWDLIIYPYRYYQAYKIMTPETKKNLYPFIAIEKHIAYWILLTAYLYFFILIGRNSYYYRILDYTKEYIFPIIIGHYLILLIYWCYIYRKWLKNFWKRILLWVHVFLWLNLLIYYGIVWILNLYI